LLKKTAYNSNDNYIKDTLGYSQILISRI